MTIEFIEGLPFSAAVVEPVVGIGLMAADVNEWGCSNRAFRLINSHYTTPRFRVRISIAECFKHAKLISPGLQHL